MANYQGKVSKIFPARYGGSFGLEGQQGLYFNTKNALPGFVQSGATVAFEAQVGRNGKSVFVTDTSLKEVAAPAPPAAPSGGFGGFGSQREDGIKYQSSRKDALAMVDLLIRNGALPLGKVDSKKAGIIEAAVDRFTAIYFEDIETMGALSRTEPSAVTPAAAAAEPEGLPE